MKSNGVELEINADLQKVILEIVDAHSNGRPNEFYNMVVSLGILAFIHFMRQSQNQNFDLNSLIKENLPLA